MKIIDISLSLDPDTPIWPGSSGFEMGWAYQISMGESYNNSYLKCDNHVGTHVDAPFHFLEHGKTVDQIPLEVLVGPVTLAWFPDTDMISEKELRSLVLDDGIRRLIFKTKNSDFIEGTHLLGKPEDAVALSNDGARWIANQDVSLVGIDALSIAKPSESRIIHQILLEAGVIIVEGLDLRGVIPGTYQLVCLPLKLSGAEASPARAVLLQ